MPFRCYFIRTTNRYLIEIWISFHLVSILAIFFQFDFFSFNNNKQPYVSLNQSLSEKTRILFGLLFFLSLRYFSFNYFILVSLDDRFIYRCIDLFVASDLYLSCHLDFSCEICFRIYLACESLAHSSHTRSSRLESVH